MDQDRSRWDQLLIRRGLAALERAERLGGDARAICAAGRDRRLPRASAPAEQTDWEHIAALYDALGQIAPSPIVELNRAVALAMASGPAAGLELVDELASEPALRQYHLLPSVRGDLLAKLGRVDEARVEFERAAALAQCPRAQAAARSGRRLCREEQRRGPG